MSSEQLLSSPRDAGVLNNKFSVNGERRGITTSGRVIKLHFACMARLPHGSSLRVSSSSLWAPIEVSMERSDDDYSHFPSSSSSSSPSSGSAGGVGGKKLGLSSSAITATTSTTKGGRGPSDSYRMYASSVEMFTTPEMYPLWRTRTPVIITASGTVTESPSDGREDLETDDDEELVKEHKYRYMVVTPGAVMAEESFLALANNDDNHDKSGDTGNEAQLQQQSQPAMGLSIGTSFGGGDYDDGVRDLPVMMCEDPFKQEHKQQQQSQLLSIASLQNLNSSNAISGGGNIDLADLPYRTRFIDVSKSSLQRGTFGSSLSFSRLSTIAGLSEEEQKGQKEDEEVHQQKENFTEDGIRIDHWNDPLDYSFRAFLHEKNVKDTEQVTLESQAYDAQISRNYNDMDVDDNVTGEENIIHAVTDHIHDSKRQKQHHPERVFLVCYHLPVLISRPNNNEGWSACWSESLIAKTEQSSVTKTHDTYWIGTVSVVPPIQSENEKQAVRNVLEPMNCIPLFLHDEIEDAHYLGMCKQVLWPAFHNIDLLEMASSGWGQRECYDNGGSGSVSTGNDLNANFFFNTHDAPTHASSVSSSFSPTSESLPVSPTTNTTKTTQSDWDQSRLDVWWSAYTAVNKIFADAIASMMRPHDTIWVHDYHLSLLPKLLDTAARQQYVDGTASSSTTTHHNHRRNYRRTIKMVYFLHIPFPTSQVFRELEHGEAILEGMLNADIVGFHAFDHARHFLNASKRILGLTYESLVGGLIGVRYKGRKVIVSMSNVSIEPDIVDAALILPSVSQEATFLKQKHGERSIIAGVDICQRLSGISLKLLSYERFLTDYPDWQPKVVMLLKCLIPGSRRTDEADALREVRFLVRRIQDTFGTSVIDYQELMGSSLPIDQRLAIWISSDVMMMTPIRQGLNLLPLEYVFCKKEPNYPGVTIASEFSAVCSVLNGALRINPFDVQITATAIEKALSMKVEEKEARRARDINFVASCPSGLWTKNVLRDLNDATFGSYADSSTDGEQESIRRKHAAEKMEAVESPKAILARENESALSKLDVDKITAAYLSCKSRVIICDFNGTLVTKEPPGKYLKREILGTAGNKPPTAVVSALNKLCADPQNTVFVVSGDSQKNLEDAVGNISGLGLAASNGACFASPFVGIQNSQRIWKSFDLGVDWNAVREVGDGRVFLNIFL